MTIKTAVTVEPAIEPVTLEETKAHLNVTFDEDDVYLSYLITVARQCVEDFLNRKLISQTVTDYRDRFNFYLPWWDGVIEKPSTYFTARVLETFWLPVVEITEVSTFAEDDTETTYSSDNYSTDTVSENQPARVILKDSATWPNNLRKANAIKVTYTAGYGPLATDVPASIRHGLLEVIMYLYVNRGACSDMSEAIYKSPAFMFLQRYRVRNV